MTRLPVKKTYKLFIGGGFPRSESGRTYEAEGQNVARASRKDVRDAVRVARGAQPGWASATAYNRGQVMYRLAEMMEARSVDLAAVCTGASEVEAAIDRVVWYAGWADKLSQVLGRCQPGGGPVLQLHDPGADRCRRRARARRAAARRARLPACTGARRRQRRRRARLAGPPAGRSRAVGGNRYERRARRGRERADGAPRRARSGARSAHGRQRDRHHRRQRRASSSWSALPRRTSSASSGRARTRARGRSPSSSS